MKLNSVNQLGQFKTIRKNDQYRHSTQIFHKQYSLAYLCEINFTLFECHRSADWSILLTCFPDFSCHHETAHNNKKLSRGNSKPFNESRTTNHKSRHVKSNSLYFTLLRQQLLWSQLIWITQVVFVPRNKFCIYLWKDLTNFSD